ncbi:hypothetical protein [Magnetococcus sp. PR-3]|uniref:hypothetical protein n=1 Tax=Magnetococcus sp. PR-3 TaxID=3120355 RepID=UPI002FCE5109
MSDKLPEVTQPSCTTGDETSPVPSSATTFLQTLLLGQNVDPTRAMLEQALSHYLPAEAFEIIASAHDEEGGSAIVKCMGRTYAIMPLDQPMAEDSFEKILNYGPQGEALRELVTSHQGHWIVSELSGGQGSGLEETISAGVGLMHFCAFLGDGLQEKIQPLGAFWNHSGMLCSWAEYLGYANQIFTAMEKQQEGDPEASSYLPETHWIGFHASDLETGGWCETVGLSLFTGYELEMTVAAWSYEQSASYVRLAIREIFQTGRILHDTEKLVLNGQTTEAFQVQLQPVVSEQPLRLALLPVST